MLIKVIENMDLDQVYFLYEGMRDLQEQGATTLSATDHTSVDWLVWALDRELERRSLRTKEEMSFKERQLYDAEAWKIQAAYEAAMARLNYSYGLVVKDDVDTAEETAYNADIDYQEMKGYAVLDDLGIDY